MRFETLSPSGVTTEKGSRRHGPSHDPRPMGRCRHNTESRRGVGGSRSTTPLIPSRTFLVRDFCLVLNLNDVHLRDPFEGFVLGEVSEEKDHLLRVLSRRRFKVNHV